MRTSEKLVKVLEIFMPHINGHNTAISTYLDAIEEVIAMEEKIEILTTKKIKSPKSTDDEDAEGLPPNYK